MYVPLLRRGELFYEGGLLWWDYAITFGKTSLFYNEIRWYLCYGDKVNFYLLMGIHRGLLFPPSCANMHIYLALYLLGGQSQEVPSNHV